MPSGLHAGLCHAFLVCFSIVMYDVAFDVDINTEPHFIVYHFISARCNIYISHLCYGVNVSLSVHLSVTEVHWVAVHAGKRGGIISRYASHC